MGPLAPCSGEGTPAVARWHSQAHFLVCFTAVRVRSGDDGRRERRKDRDRHAVDKGNGDGKLPWGGAWRKRRLLIHAQVTGARGSSRSASSVNASQWRRAVQCISYLEIPWRS